MQAGLFSTPRPMPSRVLPAAAAGLVIALALPVFLLLDLPVAGWALAALLWIGSEALTLLLTRLRPQTGNLDHKRKAGGKGDRKIRTAPEFRMLRLIGHTQRSLSQEQVGSFQLKLEISQALRFLHGAKLLADFVVMVIYEGSKSTRGG